MKWLNVIIATILGVSLFILDMKTGVISYLFVMPSVITIAIITGIVAMDIGEGFVSVALYMAIGVTLIVLLQPIILPEWGEIPADIPSMYMVVILLSVEKSLGFSSWPWLLFPLVVILLYILAPIIYFIALLLSLLGGLIGRVIARVVFKRVPSAQPEAGTPPSDTGVLE
ncbi:MAG: hypothetical protein DRO87_07045 [Candidatus Thorarchaeota archaeon]|nr:MAG: hypothetical protein DRP09_10850 [Candidatus Thorarchaeota archaeon]RLI57387.1 MAG: hypothetical protein DRO87_07045 [Candidatus Thorarchaeota archaeon]